MNAVIRTIALVTNPIAGSGRALKLCEKIMPELQKLKISYERFSTEWPLTFSKFTDVWIIGGDGTLSHFINKYSDIQLPLVIFPGGSGNDFSWMLYGNVSVEELLYKALHATARRVDAGMCNGKIFLNSTGAGFDGVVVKSIEGKNKRKGKSSFYFAVIKNILMYPEQEYIVSGDGFSFAGKFFIVSIMNGKRAGGGFYIAPTATINDGLLNVTLIKKLTMFQRLRFLPVVEKGKHIGKWYIEQIATPRLTIKSEKMMDAQLDGEYFSADTIEIEVLPSRFLFRY